MKLRALVDVGHRGTEYRKGDVFDALPDEATDLIALGLAEEAIPIEESDEKA